jgi:hypothetical protein
MMDIKQKCLSKNQFYFSYENDGWVYKKLLTGLVDFCVAHICKFLEWSVMMW